MLPEDRFDTLEPLTEEAHGTLAKTYDTEFEAMNDYIGDVFDDVPEIWELDIDSYAIGENNDHVYININFTKELRKGLLLAFLFRYKEGEDLYWSPADVTDKYGYIISEVEYYASVETFREWLIDILDNGIEY